MRVPDDIPELEDRPHDERKRIWKQAEKMHGWNLRGFAYGLPAIFSFWDRWIFQAEPHAGWSLTSWIKLLCIVVGVFALDLLLLRRLQIREVRAHIPEAIAYLETPGAGVLSPLVKVQYEREAGGDPGEKAEVVSKG